MVRTKRKALRKYTRKYKIRKKHKPTRRRRKYRKKTRKNNRRNKNKPTRRRRKKRKKTRRRGGMQNSLGETKTTTTTPTAPTPAPTPTPTPTPPPPRPRPPIASRPHENWKEIAKSQFIKKVKSNIRTALKKRENVQQKIQALKPDSDWPVDKENSTKNENAIKKRLLDKWNTLDEEEKEHWLDTRYDNQSYGESYRKANILVSYPTKGVGKYNPEARQEALVTLGKWKGRKSRWLVGTQNPAELKEFIIKHSTKTDADLQNMGKVQLKNVGVEIIDSQRHFLWRMGDGDNDFSGLGNERQDLQKKMGFSHVRTSSKSYKVMGVDEKIGSEGAVFYARPKEQKGTEITPANWKDMGFNANKKQYAQKIFRALNNYDREKFSEGERTTGKCVSKLGKTCEEWEKNDQPIPPNANPVHQWSLKAWGNASKEDKEESLRRANFPGCCTNGPVGHIGFGSNREGIESSYDSAISCTADIASALIFGAKDYAQDKILGNSDGSRRIVIQKNEKNSGDRATLLIMDPIGCTQVLLNPQWKHFGNNPDFGPAHVMLSPGSKKLYERQKPDFDDSTLPEEKQKGRISHPRGITDGESGWDAYGNDYIYSRQNLRKLAVEDMENTAEVLISQSEVKNVSKLLRVKCLGSPIDKIEIGIGEGNRGMYVKQGNTYGFSSGELPKWMVDVVNHNKLSIRTTNKYSDDGLPIHFVVDLTGENENKVGICVWTNDTNLIKMRATAFGACSPSIFLKTKADAKVGGKLSYNYAPQWICYELKLVYDKDNSNSPSLEEATAGERNTGTSGIKSLFDELKGLKMPNLTSLFSIKMTKEEKYRAKTTEKEKDRRTLRRGERRKKKMEEAEAKKKEDDLVAANANLVKANKNIRKWKKKMRNFKGKDEVEALQRKLDDASEETKLSDEDRQNITDYRNIITNISTATTDVENAELVLKQLKDEQEKQTNIQSKIAITPNDDGTVGETKRQQSDTSNDKDIARQLQQQEQQQLQQQEQNQQQQQLEADMQSAILESFQQSTLRPDASEFKPSWP